MWHDVFIQLLQENYKKLKARNKRFSQRSFGKKIGVSSGMISDVMNGKARFNKRRALEILELIEVTPKEKARLSTLMGKTEASVASIPETSEFSVFYDWQFRTILFAFDIEKYEMTPEILSEKLHIPLTEVQKRIDRLLSLNLLDKDETGKISRSKIIWKVPDTCEKQVAHKLYESNIDLARQGIVDIDSVKRDYSSMTFAGNSEQIKVLRNEIREFYQRALAIMEAPGTDEVYQMSVYVHPMLVKKV